MLAITITRREIVDIAGSPVRTLAAWHGDHSGADQSRAAAVPSSSSSALKRQGWRARGLGFNRLAPPRASQLPPITRAFIRLKGGIDRASPFSELWLTTRRHFSFPPRRAVRRCRREVFTAQTWGAAQNGDGVADVTRSLIVFFGWGC